MSLRSAPTPELLIRYSWHYALAKRGEEWRQNTDAAWAARQEIDRRLPEGWRDSNNINRMVWHFDEILKLATEARVVEEVACRTTGN